MRVIAGSARGVRLNAPQGLGVRPTRDAVREALFSILSPWIPGRRVLDLYSGSGSLGIEALSRGAEHAVFVEQNPDALDCLRGNLDRTRLSSRASVAATDVLDFLRGVTLGTRPGGYHGVFADPPFAFSASPALGSLVDALGPGPLWAEGELVALVEVDQRGARLGDLGRLPGEVEFRRYGRNLLALARRREGREANLSEGGSFESP